MVRKKGVILSLMLLSSGVVYSESSTTSNAVPDLQLQADSSSDTSAAATELRNAGKPAKSKAVTRDASASDASSAAALTTAGSTGSDATGSSASIATPSTSQTPSNPSAEQGSPVSGLEPVKPAVSADLAATLAALSPEVQALVRQQLVSSQLAAIAQDVVGELVTVTQWTEDHVRSIRAQLSPIAGEHREAAIRAIDAALQAKLREVNAKLGESMTSADAIAQLRVQSDNLRRAEAGLHSAAQRIIAHASEADAEMAATLMPGSPRTKRIATQVVAGLTTAAAVTFGTLWWLGKGAVKVN